MSFHGVGGGGGGYTGVRDKAVLNGVRGERKISVGRRVSLKGPGVV